MSTPAPKFDTATLSAAFAQVVRARRSVRGFKPTPVPAAELQKIFEIAQLAPSNCNIQPWTTHVVSGAALEKLRAALVEANAKGMLTMDFLFTGLYQGIYKQRQNDSARQLYGAMGIAREDKVGRMTALARNFQLYGAPHVALVFVDETFGVREAADCGIYLQTLMLTLAARGIDSCAQAAITFCADTVREQLGIAASNKLLFALSFGYEDPAVAANNSRVGRSPLNETTSFHE